MRCQKKSTTTTNIQAQEKIEKKKMLTFWVLHVPLKNLSQTFRQWRCYIGFKKDFFVFFRFVSQAEESTQVEDTFAQHKNEHSKSFFALILFFRLLWKKFFTKFSLQLFWILSDFARFFSINFCVNICKKHAQNTQSYIEKREERDSRIS